jgi:predicted nuclease of predicted toxin-antitoxin system
MTDLFAALYLDEDVSGLVARLVRGRGYDVLTVREAGQAGKSDPEQLAFATGDGRTIVTHNRRDFEPLASEYAVRGQNHHGIIIAVRRSPYELAQLLVNILDQLTADEMQNQLIYI